MDDAVRTAPSTARRWSFATLFVMMWAIIIVAPLSLLVDAYAGRRWISLVVFIVLCSIGMISTILITWREPRPGHHQFNGVGVSQREMEAIPAFEYRAEDADAGGGAGSSSSVEECAVCIGVLQDGERVRRLPACGHAFHALCIDGWLRGHATCPICRAGIKVVAGDGEPAPVTAAV